MQYNSNTDTVAKYLHKWKLLAYYPFAVAALLLFLYGGHIYHDRGAGSMWFFLIICIVVVPITLRSVFKTIASSNVLIDSIDLSNENISFSTHGFRMFAGLVNKRPLHIRATKDEITMRPDLKRIGFSVKYLQSTYVVIVGGQQYLLAEGLFDDFNSLKMQLETFIGRPITSA